MPEQNPGSKEKYGSLSLGTGWGLLLAAMLLGRVSDDV